MQQCSCSLRAASRGVGQPAARPAGPAFPKWRGTAVLVRAVDKACRDMANVPQPKKDIEGESTVEFLGSGGASVSITCKKGEYILDAGLEAGVELPFTCRAGICGACVVRVAEGQVDQSDIADLSFTLTDEEVAAGLALICMARPVTDSLKLETQSDWGYGLDVGGWQGATGVIGGKKVDPLMGRKWDEIQEEGQPR